MGLRAPRGSDLAGRAGILLAGARVPSRGQGQLPSHCRTRHQAPRDSGRPGAAPSPRCSAGRGPAWRPQGPGESSPTPQPSQPRAGWRGLPISAVQRAKRRRGRGGGPAPGLGTPILGLIHPYRACQLPPGLSGEGERRFRARTRKPRLRSSKTSMRAAAGTPPSGDPSATVTITSLALGGSPLSTLRTAPTDNAERRDVATETNAEGPAASGAAAPPPTPGECCGALFPPAGPLAWHSALAAPHLPRIFLCFVSSHSHSRALPPSHRHPPLPGQL